MLQYYAFMRALVSVSRWRAGQAVEVCACSPEQQGSQSSEPNASTTVVPVVMAIPELDDVALRLASDSSQHRVRDATSPSNMLRAGAITGHRRRIALPSER
mmetsp:Transcript_1339/g.3784  ORF Transcript_1339/g.3784 Transcript_1339/m.3784 type:complete len:101 (-) Transcript_1339:308-610(-)